MQSIDKSSTPSIQYNTKLEALGYHVCAHRRSRPSRMVAAVACFYLLNLRSAAGRTACL